MSEQAKQSVLVSVIIPTYNRASTLPRAIKSVLNQDYENLELIVVDDASTDETAEVLSRIDDPRMRVIVHDHNKGRRRCAKYGNRGGKG